MELNFISRFINKVNFMLNDHDNLFGFQKRTSAIHESHTHDDRSSAMMFFVDASRLVLSHADDLRRCG